MTQTRTETAGTTTFSDDTTELIVTVGPRDRFDCRTVTTTHRGRRIGDAMGMNADRAEDFARGHQLVLAARV